MPVSPDAMPKARQSSKKWDVLPGDTFQVQVLDVDPDIDEYEGEVKDIYKITCVVVDRGYVFEGAINGEQNAYGRRIYVETSRTCSPAAKNPASNLYKFARAAFKRELGQNEVYDKFDPNSLIGHQLKVEVEQRTSKAGNVYLKPVHYTKAARDLPVFNPDDFKKDDAPAGGNAKASLDDVPF